MRRGTTRPPVLACKEAKSTAGVPVTAERFYRGKHGSYWLVMKTGKTYGSNDGQCAVIISISEQLQATLRRLQDHRVLHRVALPIIIVRLGGASSNSNLNSEARNARGGID